MDDSDQRTARRLQGQLRVLEREAPCLDSGLDIFPRSFSQGCLADPVRNLEAHEQPGQIWIAGGQIHQMAVGDADLLGGILDRRLSLLQKSQLFLSGHSPGGR